MDDFLVWDGCYDSGWTGMIVPEAFSHPAKFARGLVERIIRHGLECGYWRENDLLGDPFGGVALGGIVAAYHGLAWIGVELEEKFRALGQANIDLHAGKLKALGVEPPVILKGDSRNFAEIIQGAAGICTSPPYANQEMDYGDRPNRAAKIADNPNFAGRTHWLNNDRTTTAYGKTEGQIGQLPPGDLAGICTSPPFMSSDNRDADKTVFAHKFHGGQRYADERPVESSIGGDRTSDEARAARKQRAAETANIGQIVQSGNAGNLVNVDSYWQAMSLVYAQCLQALKPGGVMAVVIKSYVKAGKIVPLPDQTWQLLLHLGFQPVERVHAMLVKETSTEGLFGQVNTKKERKSFFRRLAEKKGSPAIDYEEVLFVRKETL